MAKKFNFHLAAPVTAVAPASGEVDIHTKNAITLPTGNKGAVWEATADASYDFTSLTGKGVYGENVAFTKIHAMVIEVVKTALASSGTIVIDSDTFKLDSYSVDAGSTENAAAASGSTIWAFAIALMEPKSVSTATHLDLNFTTPVGFKVRVTLTGE